MRKLATILSGVLMLGTLLSGCSIFTPKTVAIAPDIKVIKDRGTLKVGIKEDVPNFGYKDPKSKEIDGFEIDLAKAMAKKIVGDESKIDLIAVTANTRGPLLDSGAIDLAIATFTISDERKKSYNFSDPYFTDNVGLLVKKSSYFHRFQDLNGKKIGVVQGSTSKKAVQDQSDQLDVTITLQEFVNNPEIKAALDSGRVNAFSSDRSILSGYVDDSTVLLPDSFSPQPYGIATKKGNDNLADLVNVTINDMMKSGEMDKLLQKWNLKK